MLLGNVDLNRSTFVLAADVLKLVGHPLFHWELLLQSFLNRLYQVLLSHEHYVINMGQQDAPHIATLMRVTNLKDARVDGVLFDDQSSPINGDLDCKDLLGELHPP